jgi:SAM-dependent MidA family methyltransferase
MKKNHATLSHVACNMKEKLRNIQKQHLQHFETTSATFENTSQHPASLKHPDLLFQHPRKILATFL